MASIVDLEDPNPGAIVNCSELVQPFSSPRNSLQKLHVHLQSVPRLRLLVSDPAFRMRLMFLIGGEAIYPVSSQNPMDRGGGDRNAVKSLQVVCYFAGAEMIVLAQIQDLANDI